MITSFLRGSKYPKEPEYYWPDCVKKKKNPFVVCHCLRDCLEEDFNAVLEMVEKKRPGVQPNPGSSSNIF